MACPLNPALQLPSEENLLPLLLSLGGYPPRRLDRGPASAPLRAAPSPGLLDQLAATAQQAELEEEAEEQEEDEGQRRDPGLRPPGEGTPSGAAEVDDGDAAAEEQDDEQQEEEEEYEEEQQLGVKVEREDTPPSPEPSPVSEQDAADPI